MSIFNYISYWLKSFGTVKIERKIFFPFRSEVVLVVATPASLERFTFFLLGLSDLDDSVILKFCFEYFSKDSYHMSKSVAS